MELQFEMARAAHGSLRGVEQSGCSVSLRFPPADLQAEVFSLPVPTAASGQPGSAGQRWGSAPGPRRALPVSSCLEDAGWRLALS